MRTQRLLVLVGAALFASGALAQSMFRGDLTRSGSQSTPGPR